MHIVDKYSTWPVDAYNLYHMTRKIWFDWKKKGNNKIWIKENKQNKYDMKNYLQDLWSWMENVTKMKREDNKLEHMVQTIIGKLNPVPCG